MRSAIAILAAAALTGCQPTSAVQSIAPAAPAEKAAPPAPTIEKKDALAAEKVWHYKLSILVLCGLDLADKAALRSQDDPKLIAAVIMETCGKQRAEAALAYNAFQAASGEAIAAGGWARTDTLVTPQIVNQIVGIRTGVRSPAPTRQPASKKTSI